MIRLYKYHVKKFNNLEVLVSKRKNAKYKISRRFNCSLWGRAKDPYNTRNYPPGVHGRMGYSRRKDYGLQLDAKQKLKFYYGDLREKTLKRIYTEARRRKGDSGQNLVGLLESMLMTFVYRAGFAPTVFAARQLVNHKHFTVNGKRVNVPFSYILKEGDVVEVNGKSREVALINDSLDSGERDVPEYIELDRKKLKATFVRQPKLDEIPYPVEMEPHLVVEFYSRV